MKIRRKAGGHEEQTTLGITIYYALFSGFCSVWLISHFYTFFLSVHHWDGMLPKTFIGLDNFKRLLKDDYFYQAAGNTLRIWLFNFIPQMATAMLLSCIFTFQRIKGMKFFRAAYYLPNLITAASVGLLFNLLFNGDKSAANYVLLQTGLLDKPFSFFNSPAFTSGLVSYIQWWMWYGYTTVIVMAGMTTVDGSLYEAAMVDGATRLQTFAKITVPLIKPTLIYLMITSIIGGMQLFDVPATLTNANGDPQKSILTTTMYIYNQGFKSYNYGYACAVSVGLFTIIALLSVISFKAMQRKGDLYDA